MSNISSNELENKAAQPKIIVSLTTYPGRIDRVNIAIESLLHQTQKADMIVLWLAEEQFPGKEQDLPAQLLALKDRGLRIEWCEDIKSYKKLLPSVRRWPNDIIITADDDIVYRVDTIENLVKCHERHPECVCTVRSHLMLFDDDGNIRPYNDWKPEYNGIIDQPQMALFPTTGAGTLFPPHVLPEQAFDREAYMSLCPKADDIWTKCMLTLANVPVVLATESARLLYVEGTQQETLYSYNLTENDTQLAAVLNAYNVIGGEECPEDTLLWRMNDLSEYRPEDSLCQKHRTNRSFANEKLGVKVSIIIAAQNAEKNIKRCLTSAAGQTISDIEIICADIGSTDNTARIISSIAENDDRIRLITIAEPCSMAEARRRAVLDCKGEYCLFMRPDGILAPDACEQLYKRAEDSDSDILAFTRGTMHHGASKPIEIFTGHKGRLRNTRILPDRFSGEIIPENDLFGCLFSSRMSRRAYIHAENINADSLYEYFILCRSAEVYTGEKTPIYYIQQEIQCEPQKTSDSLRAMEEYAKFAGISEEITPLIAQMRYKCVDRSIEQWHALPEEMRFEAMGKLTNAWTLAEIAAGLARLHKKSGPEILRTFLRNPYFQAKRTVIENVGVAVLDGSSADELFTMTEALDCIAVNRTAVLVGVSKTAASAAVSSAKAACVGEKLNEDESENEYVFANNLAGAIDDEAMDAIVIPAQSSRFIGALLHAKLRGVAVIALLTEPFCQPMLDGSEQFGGLSALRLADTVVTDSPVQQDMLTRLGINARYIPRPAIRLMGGRSGGRASANAIVWAGEEKDAAEAMELFSIIKEEMSDARMLMYVDRAADTEQLSAVAPEGVSVRRLRPDYGIFADAAVHLMTRGGGTVPAALHAARTMGVPTAMYELPGEPRDGAGAVIVCRKDIAACAREVARLLRDKQARDNLSAQAKAAAGAHSREEVAVQWNSVLDSAVRHSAPDQGKKDKAFEAAMLFYEDGAHVNELRLEEFRQRCEEYEQRLAAAEQRRVEETNALQTTIERTKEQLREKEHARQKISGELEDLRGSTLYKVGAAITAIPRYIKKLISGGKDQ